APPTQPETPIASDAEPAEPVPDFPTDPNDPQFWPSVNALAKSLQDQARGTDPDLRGRVDGLSNVVRRIQAGISHERDKSDFDRVVGIANKEYLSGLNLPDDYAERWLKAEVLSNPQLAEAFDGRYQSPAHERQAEHILRKAFSRMREQATRLPD